MFCGCRSSEKGSVASSSSDRYRRAPLVEVSAERLQQEGRLVDAVALTESGHQAEALALYSRLASEDASCAAAWYGMSQLLLQRGWTDSARACARRAVALHDDNIWYVLALAQAEEMSGDAAGLAEAWERAVALRPEVAQYHFALAEAYAQAGKADRAVAALNRLEDRVGVTEEVSLAKQRIWIAAGKEEKAMKEVEKLAEALPQERRYNAILAEMYMQQGQYKKAKRYYDRIVAAHPDDPYIHIQLAEYYKATGHPADADSAMVKAFSIDGLDTRSKLQVLTQFYTTEEFYTTRRATTFRLAEMALRDCRDSADYGAFYGHVLLLQGRHDEAVRWIERALAKDSSQYDVWELLLVTLDAKGDTTGYLADRARRAMTLFPMQTLPCFLLARDAVIHKRYEEALEPLRQAMKWGFDKGHLEAECQALMGEACYRTGRYDEAWRAFEACLALLPDEAGTLNNYAWYLAEQHTELEKAERLSRHAIELEPDNANSLDTYGWILHLLGRDDEALKYLRKAVHLDPQSETLQRHLKEVEP